MKRLSPSLGFFFLPFSFFSFVNWTRRQFSNKLVVMHELTITVDDTVYKTLKPLVDQQMIGPLLYEFIQNRAKERSIPDIKALRGTLHQVDTSDIRDEDDRLI